MRQQRSYRTEGVVLRRTEFGEADRIVTFLTPDLGKIKVVARAVRKPKSKLAGTVELFTHSSLLIARGHGMDVLSQAETLHTFLPLKTDLERSSCGFYVVELVNRFTVEHQEAQEVFALLLKLLDELCSAMGIELLLRRFEMDLLQNMGYRPNLRECVGCNVRLEPRTNAFSASGGGVLCPTCAGKEPIARPITVNAIKMLRLLQDGDFAVASRVVMDQRLSSELEQVLRSYVEYILERRVRSADWMDRVREAGRSL